jgi:hypothetical protein
MTTTTRVQIPAYLDRWMMGDRYGEIVKTYKRKGRAKNGREDPSYDVALVRLDKSGKTIPVMLADCQIVLPPSRPWNEV